MNDIDYLKCLLLRRFLTSWNTQNSSILCIEPQQPCFGELLKHSNCISSFQHQRFLHHQQFLHSHHSDSCVFSADGSLPFDDKSFQYSVVINNVERWKPFTSHLQEVIRVTNKSCILFFLNSYSLYSIHNYLNKGGHHKRACETTGSTSLSPLFVYKSIYSTLTFKKITSLSAGYFLEKKPKRKTLITALPLGKVVAVKIDLFPALGTIKTPLYVKRPVPVRNEL